MDDFSNKSRLGEKISNSQPKKRAETQFQNFLPLSRGHKTAALFLLMGIRWATEALPVAVTALVPLALFPLLGIVDIQSAATPYANKTIYLFFGGFLIATAIQKWDLHKRIALVVLDFAGSNGASLVGGFMLTAALISMWVMNTATTIMLLPIGLAVIRHPANVGSSIITIASKGAPSSARVFGINP